MNKEKRNKGKLIKPYLSLYSLDVERRVMKDGKELLIIKKDTTISNILFRAESNNNIWEMK